MLFCPKCSLGLTSVTFDQETDQGVWGCQACDATFWSDREQMLVELKQSLKDTKNSKYLFIRGSLQATEGWSPENAPPLWSRYIEASVAIPVVLAAIP